MNGNRLPSAISEALAGGATLICASAQRQAAIRAAWAESQRDAGRTLWQTPRVFTFAQFAERALQESWAQAQLADRLLSPAAEWAALREWREAGGAAEVRALLNAVRTLGDWNIARSAQALGGSPEGEMLLGALAHLDELTQRQGRKALRDWLAMLAAIPDRLISVAGWALAAAPRAHLQRWQALDVAPTAGGTPVAVATAEDDDHELELIAAWCRRQLASDPQRRLLVVDARLRQKRGLYDRILSQTLSPSHWLRREARAPSTVYTVEGGRPFAEFPVIAHALLSLRLLTGRVRFDEIVHWLRLPFLDAADHMAGVAVEELLRQGRRLEWSAAELAAMLAGDGPAAGAGLLAARLRQALATLEGMRAAAEWSPRLLLALRQLGWPGSRPLRSDEQQTVARWHALLDEYAALGAWLPRGAAADAVAALADLAAERQFDPASVDAPITLTDSHDDPVVRYDAVWIAGLDATSWPPPPRPDPFIPLRLQVQAGIPWASARGQTAAARRSLDAWRAVAGELTCSWARLEGDAHRAISPLLARLPEQRVAGLAPAWAPLAEQLRQQPTELLEDLQGSPVDTREVVAGGVRPLELQGECGFHAYAQVRLGARELEQPAPGLDPRERGVLLHKALELVWIELKDYWHLQPSTEQLRKPLIHASVEAAKAAVFRGFVPHELRPALEREQLRLERLIEALLAVESRRPPFQVEALETRREVSIAGGRFAVRIDRIDSLEGGGYAILDYKSGEARAPRWQGEQIRDPQLLAYLLAEAGRNVQALANVSLANNRARFVGRSSRTGLLPEVRGLPGMDANRVAAEDIDRAWQEELERWLLGLARIATDYLAGHAPVQPAADVCRSCHLTVLCRRVELNQAELEAGDHGGE